MRRSQIPVSSNRFRNVLRSVAAVCWIIAASACSAPAPPAVSPASTRIRDHNREDNKLPLRVQVGDLVFDIPADQKFISPGPPDRTEFDYSKVARVPGALQVDSIDMIQQNAWHMSGTHVGAKGWEPTMLLVNLWAVDRAADIDGWCNSRNPTQQTGQNYHSEPDQILDNEFYIYHEGSVNSGLDSRIFVKHLTIFNSSVIFYTFTISGLSRQGIFGEWVHYMCFIALTRNVVLEIRFTDHDLRSVSARDLMLNIEASIKKWYVGQVPLDNLLLHKKSMPCSNP